MWKYMPIPLWREEEKSHSWVAWLKLPWFYSITRWLQKNCTATAGIWGTFTLTVHYFKGARFVRLSFLPYLKTLLQWNSETLNYHFWPTVSWHENPGFVSTKYDTGLVCWVKRNEESHTDLITVTFECSEESHRKLQKSQKLPKTPLKNKSTLKLEKPTGNQKFSVATVLRELSLTTNGYTDDGLLLAGSGLSYDIACGIKLSSDSHHTPEQSSMHNTTNMNFTWFWDLI